MENDILISLNNVSYAYGEVLALDDVSIDIKRGDFVGVIGPNGGGKSTFIKLILGILKADKGRVKVADDIIFGYVPQVTTFEKTFPISVMDVVLTGHLPKKIRLRHRFSKHEQEHAIAVMDSLKIKDLSDKKISDLSLGQLQKVLIARALMNHPNLLILDEPTASIDAKSSAEIYAMIKDLSKKITIIMITHDVSRDLTFFDELIYVNKSIHFHSKEKQGERLDSCPIDWLRSGEQIHKNMRTSKFLRAILTPALQTKKSKNTQKVISLS